MSARPTQLKGKTYNSWTVLRAASRNKFWVCRCVCGTVREVNHYSLIDGASKCCGCISRKITHGLSSHPLFKIWEGMIARCHSKTHKDFNNYGGRGIKVCNRWRHSITGPTNFIEDMYSTYKKGLELDRKDNEKGYSVENCRWVTRRVNVNNRRVTVYLTIKGKRYALTDAADKFGIGPKTILFRKKLGWSDEACVSPPYQLRGKANERSGYL